MADVAEREGVAVICRDSSRLRDDVYGAPVLGFAGSPEIPHPHGPIPGRNLPRGLTASALPTPGPFSKLETALLPAPLLVHQRVDRPTLTGDWR